MKTCRKCKLEKPLAEFWKRTCSSDGLADRCKTCASGDCKKWRVENPEKEKEHHRKYYAKNREKIKGDSRRWQAENPEKVKEKGRRYRAANPERAKEDGRKYRAANPEKVIEYSRKYRAENREKLNEDNRKYYASNQEKILSLAKEKKYGISAKDIEQMKLTQGGACAICKVVPKKRLRIDHDHSSGRVRALLCDSCNLALGLLKDSSAIARSAAEYLDHFSRHSAEG